MGENREEQVDRSWWVQGRLVLYLVAALLLLDVAIFSGRNLWRTYDPDDYREKLRGVRLYPSEVVVVGGSPVAEGIDPTELVGLSWRGQTVQTVYNLGLPGATTSEVWHAVKHGLDACPPRLLIYGVTASDLNDNRQEPHGPSSLMDRRDVVEWLRTKEKSNEWVLRQFAESQVSKVWQLWRYRNGIRMWAADRLETLQPGLFPEAAADARHNLRYASDLRRRDGFAPLPAHQIQLLTELKRNKIVNLERFHFLDGYRVGEHLTYLHRLLDWAEQRQVEVVLVDMPVSRDLEKNMPASKPADLKEYPKAFACYRAALAEVERSRGVQVLRATRHATQIGDKDFADLIHLNASGTHKLSTWIRRQLKAH